MMKMQLVLCGALALQACGGPQSLLKSIDVNTSDSSGDLILSMESELEMGRLIFPSLTLPLVDPKRPLDSYGTITVMRDLNGANVLALDINMTKVIDLDVASDARLPNGNPIPVANLDEIIPIQTGGDSKAYVGFSDTNIVVGVAVAINEFNNIGRYVPGVNLFYDIGSSNGVSGLFGVFTGSNDGTNGLALFFDATKASIGVNPTNVTAQFQTSQKKTRSQRARDYLESRLHKLSRSKKVLEVE